MKTRCFLIFALFSMNSFTLAESDSWNLWPSEPPSEKGEIPPEYDQTGPDDRLVAGKRVVRLTNVSVPEITFYKANPAINTGTTIVIAPGGGFYVLAYDLEGTEVAEWLNSIGMTAVVLKYRVPKNREGALQDAQRGMGLIREHAKEWGIDPGRVGVLGFSAGGHLSARLSTVYSQRQYDPIDQADAYKTHL